ncbi:cytochrome c biogenesis CcdA family protein [Patescibacteria group bacterium]|nr:cytochrome c biogenesis CcdA family protein [Patescibacteria group bacterium]
MLQVLFALLAGILTLASPCILPLLPILLGVSIGHKNTSRPLFIVAGFILSFSLTAIFISALTRIIGLDPNTLRSVGVVILALFGALLIWPAPFDRFMSRFSGLFAKAAVVTDPEKTSNLSGFVLGATLGVIWTPCAGPVLASVLTLIALQKQTVIAAILLVAYAIGAGIPMLVIAYGGQYVSTRINAFARYSLLLQRIFGVLIILLCIAIYFNYDILLYSMFFSHFPGLAPAL